MRKSMSNNRITVKKNKIKDYIRYELSNGWKFNTKMEFPNNRSFFEKLYNFAETHAIYFRERFLSPPYVYGQVNVNDKIIFLEYHGEENNEFKYKLANIVTDTIIGDNSSMWGNDVQPDIERRLQELTNVCGSAIESGEAYEEENYSKLEYFEDIDFKISKWEFDSFDNFSED